MACLDEENDSAHVALDNGRGSSRQSAKPIPVGAPCFVKVIPQALTVLQIFLKSTKLT